MISPRATARLQFHRGFTLDDARDVVPYLHRLGVSHLYASPLFTARPGSPHGYDVIDPNVINPELGGEDALQRLVAALRGLGMGLILDIVPNHMAADGGRNPWWRDVLEWGRASPYAAFFDIDWSPPDPALRGRLLAPFLGQPYGACLAAGEITLAFDAAEGRLAIAYFDHRFPLAARDYPAVLAAAGGAIADAVGPLASMAAGAGNAAAARAASAAARRKLAASAHAPAIMAALAAFASPDPEGCARLHALLERQVYRLAWWRAAEAINWRRFFDINGLAALRSERKAVFAATHQGVARLHAEGLIDGLRIDHVDGLADPGGYCRRLRRLLAEAAPGQGAIPIWVEKILAPDERLPASWKVAGTTGYDFMDQVSAVLHDADGAPALDAAWAAVSGKAPDFTAEVAAARARILAENLAAELTALIAALRGIAASSIATRDHHRPAIARVLAALLAEFPVYRLYADRHGPSAADRRVMQDAHARAADRLDAADHALLAMVVSWVSGGGIAGTGTVKASSRASELRAMARFQKLTAPLVAKSVEDTAFYRFGRLLSRNEVGSDPARLARPPDAFHAAMASRHAEARQALLATATHDHKRGEDARARLAVLSERPELWAAALADWLGRTAMVRQSDHVPSGEAPAADDCAMLLQTIIGAWPLDLGVDDAAGRARFAERVAGWQRKALREAKRHSSWAQPDAAYERAAAGFLAHLLDPGRSAGITAEIAALVAHIAPAGALNGLTQTTLKLTVPGIPDLYQGAEVWDFSLVDPDNRRAVDFAALTAMLTAPPPAALLPCWRDGAVKQALIARLLGLRARLPEIFVDGAYRPLRIVGARSRHALAFARVHGLRAMVVVVTRLAARLAGVERAPLVAAEAWEDTEVVLPPFLAEGEGTDALSGAAIALAPRLRLGALLAPFPASVIVVER